MSILKKERSLQPLLGTRERSGNELNSHLDAGNRAESQASRPASTVLRFHHRDEAACQTGPHGAVQMDSPVVTRLLELTPTVVQVLSRRLACNDGLAGAGGY